MSRPHLLACPDRRDTLVAVAAGLSKRDLALETHLIACNGCRGFLVSVEAQLRALSELRPMSAPRELDGLVVAATQAGYRQDRAVAALRAIGKTPMPAEVDRVIWPVGLKAPPVLDRLVERDLQDPTHSIGRRFAGRLDRVPVPPGLQARVESIYALRRKRRESPARRLSLASGLVALAALAIAITWFVARPGQAIAAEPRFVIEHVTSPSAFDPLLESTLSALLGGVPDAESIVKGKKL
jgi:uncharacterized protein YbaR (Trm112 family)